MSMSDPLNHLGSILPFRASRGPIFSKPVSWLGLVFALSYNKPALRSWPVGFLPRFRYICIYYRAMSFAWAPNNSPPKDQSNVSPLPFSLSRLLTYRVTLIYIINF